MAFVYWERMLGKSKKGTKFDIWKKNQSHKLT